MALRIPKTRVICYPFHYNTSTRIDDDSSEIYFVRDMYTTYFFLNSCQTDENFHKWNFDKKISILQFTI